MITYDLHEELEKIEFMTEALGTPYHPSQTNAKNALCQLETSS
jgi:hypothetical protein